MDDQIIVQFPKVFYTDGPLALVPGPATVHIDPRDDSMDQRFVHHFAWRPGLITVTVGIFRVHHRQQIKFHERRHAPPVQGPPCLLSPFVHSPGYSLSMCSLPWHSPPYSFLSGDIHKTTQGPQRPSRFGHFWLNWHKSTQHQLKARNGVLGPPLAYIPRSAQCLMVYLRRGEGGPPPRPLPKHHGGSFSLVHALVQVTLFSL